MSKVTVGGEGAAGETVTVAELGALAPPAPEHVNVYV
jgi:hypothetical protein